MDTSLVPRPRTPEIWIGWEKHMSMWRNRATFALRQIKSTRPRRSSHISVLNLGVGRVNRPLISKIGSRVNIMGKWEIWLFCAGCRGQMRRPHRTIISDFLNTVRGNFSYSICILRYRIERSHSAPCVQHSYCIPHVRFKLSHSAPRLLSNTRLALLVLQMNREVPTRKLGDRRVLEVHCFSLYAVSVFT